MIKIEVKLVTGLIWFELQGFLLWINSSFYWTLSAGNVVNSPKPLTGRKIGKAFLHFKKDPKLDPSHVDSLCGRILPSEYGAGAKNAPPYFVSPLPPLHWTLIINYWFGARNPLSKPVYNGWALAGQLVSMVITKDFWSHPKLLASLHVKQTWKQP